MSRSILECNSLLDVMEWTKLDGPSEEEAVRMRERLMDMHLFSDFICKECGEDTLLTYFNDPHFRLLKVLIGGLSNGQLAALHDYLMKWDNFSFLDREYNPETHPIAERERPDAEYCLNHNALASLERLVANQFPKQGDK